MLTTQRSKNANAVELDERFTLLAVNAIRQRRPLKHRAHVPGQELDYCTTCGLGKNTKAVKTKASQAEKALAFKTFCVHPFVQVLTFQICTAWMLQECHITVFLPAQRNWRQ